jgi:protein SCO1
MLITDFFRSLPSALGLAMIAVCASLVFEPALAADTPAAVSSLPDRARAYFGDHVLTDQDGEPHRFYTDLLHGRVVLINVVFTNCPSACPMMTERLKLVRKRLGPEFGEDIHFLSLSVDPARDTPEAMKRFAQRHGVDEPGWRFLVADAKAMQALLSRLGQWTDSPEDHTTLLIAGNAAKAHWAKLRPDASPEQIAAELERLK